MIEKPWIAIKKNIIVTWIAVCSLLTGCSGSSSSVESNSTESTNAPVVAFVDANISEDLGSTIDGTDSNSNGIRDDIDTLIEQTFSDSNALRTLTSNYAASQQRYMSASNRTDVITGFAVMSNQLICLEAMLSEDSDVFSEIVNEIVAWTANTQIRAEALLLSDRMLENSEIAFPENVDCDNS